MDTNLTTDPDFELLESYLDGELPSADVRQLERRLENEPELAEALARMSAEYAARHAVWRAMEPRNAEARAMAETVTLHARRAAGWQRWGRVARYASGVAAAIAVSFFAGWIGRGYFATPASTVTTGPEVTPTVATSTMASVREVRTGMYQVALTDADGNITAVQQFERLEDARAFAAEVGRWQAEMERGHAILSSSGL